MSSTPVRWIILRTAGQRTLALTEALKKDGYAAWTPTAIRRVPRVRHSPEMVERSFSILPTFVFARSDHLIDLARERLSRRLPDFSIFQRGGYVPLIGEKPLAGLREAEAEAERALQALHDADERERQRVERVAHLRTESARRRALRQVRKDMTPGTKVVVSEMPAFAGLTGEVVENRGTSAIIAFGGLLTMEVEAWQLHPDSLAGASLVSHDRHGAVC